ncbi:unnamed protein product, partial [Symbiodinium sp. CCMP2456]
VAIMFGRMKEGLGSMRKKESPLETQLKEATSREKWGVPNTTLQAIATATNNMEDCDMVMSFKILQDTLMAASADGSLEAALQSKTQVAGLLAGWAADNCSTEHRQANLYEAKAWGPARAQAQQEAAAAEV